MLTRLVIRNFKRFGRVEIDLGSPVVFIGPNNSGKTSAMQALALWDVGFKRWNEKRAGKSTPEKPKGVTVNRRDRRTCRSSWPSPGDWGTTARALERPFVHYAGNRVRAVQSHFHGLREALPQLRGAALFDRLEMGLPDMSPIECLTWTRREIENYVCTRATLEAYAVASAPDGGPGPLFTAAEADRRLRAMRESIGEIESALTLGKGAPWDPGVKASDEFLDPLFQAYFASSACRTSWPRRTSTSWPTTYPTGRSIPKSPRSSMPSRRSPRTRRRGETAAGDGDAGAGGPRAIVWTVEAFFWSRR